MTLRQIMTLNEAEQIAINYGVVLNDFIKANEGKLRCSIWESPPHHDEFVIIMDDPNQIKNSKYLNYFLKLAQSLLTFTEVSSNRVDTRFHFYFRRLSFIEINIDELERMNSEYQQKTIDNN